MYVSHVFNALLLDIGLLSHPPIVVSRDVPHAKLKILQETYVIRHPWSLTRDRGLVRPFNGLHGLYDPDFCRGRVTAAG